MMLLLIAATAQAQPFVQPRALPFLQQHALPSWAVDANFGIKAVQPAELYVPASAKDTILERQAKMWREAYEV